VTLPPSCFTFLPKLSLIAGLFVGSMVWYGTIAVIFSRIYKNKEKHIATIHNVTGILLLIFAISLLIEIVV
jgi:arginine exporter protein ArgO